LLADLAIENALDTILDPACGSGVLLVASYHRRKQITPSIQSHLLLQNTYGFDISPLACLLASMNLLIQSSSTVAEHANIVCNDAFNSYRSKKLDEFFDSKREESNQIGELQKFDVLLGNPPFTQGDRLDSQYKDQLYTWFEKRGVPAKKLIDKKHLGLHGYFLLAASQFLKPRGTLALILPFSTLYTESNEPIVRYLLQMLNIEYIIKSEVEPAFSDSTFEEIILIGSKIYNGPIKIVILQKSLREKSLENIDLLANTIKHATSDGDFEGFRLLSVPKSEFSANRWTVFFRSYNFVSLWRELNRRTESITGFAVPIRGNRVAPVHLLSLPNKIWKIVSITPDHLYIQNRKDSSKRFKFSQENLVPSMKRYNEMAQYPNIIPEGDPHTYYIKMNPSSEIFKHWLRINDVKSEDNLPILYPPIDRSTQIALPQKIGWNTTKTIVFYSHTPLHVGDGFMSIEMDSNYSFWYFCYLTSSFGVFNALALWRAISGNYGQILGPDMHFFRYPDFSNLSSPEKKILEDLVIQVSQKPVNEKPTFLEIIKSIQEDPRNPLYQIDLIIAKILGLDSSFLQTLHSVLITELSRYK
jgi:type I restriction-modification system DNA methylase subunit